MTIRDVVRKVALRVIGSKPVSAFSPSTDKQTVDEIVDLANDVARDIAASHDWQALTKIGTITGNGGSKKFPLPADYDRMLLASYVTDQKSWFWGYSRIESVNDWLEMESDGWALLSPGAWIILNNEFNFVPTPVAGQKAAYPYISRNIVKSGADRKPAFTTDSDEFVLDERLLVLGTIWRWKEQKGLEYAEDMQTSERALSQAQARDGGARAYRSGGHRSSFNTRPAWPFVFGGQ